MIMAFEERLSLAYVGPFGETLAPPDVVFGDGMELGEIGGEDAGVIQEEIMR